MSQRASTSACTTFSDSFPATREKLQGDKAEPTYSNVPAAPVQFLKLSAPPSEWKKTEVVLPGSAFPLAEQTYVVVFQAVKTGGPKSDNLFTGSALLAGTADVGVVRTH